MYFFYDNCAKDRTLCYERFHKNSISKTQELRRITFESRPLKPLDQPRGRNIAQRNQTYRLARHVLIENDLKENQTKKI